MVIIRCPYKVIIGGVHQIPQVFNGACYLINKLLRSNPCFLCLQFNLLSMLIRSRLEEHVIAVFPFKSGNAVCQHNLIAVADVRLTRSIGNRRRNIILTLTHFISSLEKLKSFLLTNYTFFLLQKIIIDKSKTVKKVNPPIFPI